MAIETAAEARAAMKRRLPVRVDNIEGRPRGIITEVGESLSSGASSTLTIRLDDGTTVHAAPGNVTVSE